MQSAIRVMHVFLMTCTRYILSTSLENGHSCNVNFSALSKYVFWNEIHCEPRGFYCEKHRGERSLGNRFRLFALLFILVAFSVQCLIYTAGRYSLLIIQLGIWLFTKALQRVPKNCSLRFPICIAIQSSLESKDF